MEKETKETIRTSIIITTLLLTAACLFNITKERTEIKEAIESQVLVSTTIDTIYEQCIEEGNITITAQKTLEGKTATLSKQGETTCAIEIKEKTKTP